MSDSDPFAGFLDRLLDGLIDEQDARSRDGALLDGVLASGAAGAAALWLPDPTDPARWIPALERGSAERLPGRDEVEAARAGTAGPELPLGRVVFVSEDIRGGAALALADVRGDEAVDRIEGLFHVWACVVAAHESGAPVDALPAPVPRADASMELRSFLDAVDAERPAFRRLGFDLAVETGGDLLHHPPALGERRLYHLVRSLLGEVRATVDAGAHPSATVRIRCHASEDAAEVGWQLSGSLEAERGGTGSVFRLWLPVAGAA